MPRYEAVIGLEVHAQLRTKTKIFCGCSTEYGAPPNSQTCPVCLGHPGVLPVLNAAAVELAVRGALALACTVHWEEANSGEISELRGFLFINGHWIWIRSPWIGID